MKTSNLSPKDSRANSGGKDKKSTVSSQPAIDCVHVVVYSDAIINIDRCIKALDDKISLQYLQRTMKPDQDMLKNLNDEQVHVVDTVII